MIIFESDIEVLKQIAVNFLLCFVEEFCQQINRPSNIYLRFYDKKVLPVIARD